MSEPSFKDEKEKLERHLTILISQPLREYIVKHKLDYISIRLDYDKIDVTNKESELRKVYILTNLQVKLFI